MAFLEQYILNELNVQTLTVSADRERYHVRVRIALSLDLDDIADWDFERRLKLIGVCCLFY